MLSSGTGIAASAEACAGTPRASTLDWLAFVASVDSFASTALPSIAARLGPFVNASVFALIACAVASSANPAMSVATNPS